MVKVMFFLYRRADLERDAFERYSHETHIPLVAQVPGLERYVVNHGLPGQSPPAPPVAYRSRWTSTPAGQASGRPAQSISSRCSGRRGSPAKSRAGPWPTA